MKTRQRRSFSADMKARIALEAIKGQKTIQEIASHYGVHPNQVTNWKRQAVEGTPALFADRRSQPDVREGAPKGGTDQPTRPIEGGTGRLQKKTRPAPYTRGGGRRSESKNKSDSPTRP